MKQALVREFLSPDFEDMCELEPRLRQLERLVDRYTDPGTDFFCAKQAWAISFKPMFGTMAGVGARNPEMREIHLFNAAKDHLMALMPKCRGCGCAPAVSSDILDYRP